MYLVVGIAEINVPIPISTPPRTKALVPTLRVGMVFVRTPQLA